VTPFALNELVNGGLLAPAGEGWYPAWMVPLASDRETNPPYDYVVSFIRLHERGFTAPASRFMRGLCYHYGVELHNFAPNTISQAATFVAVREGFLGIPANWDLWLHLFRAELHTLATGEARVHRGGSRRRPDIHDAVFAQRTIPAVHDDFEQCGLGEGVVLPLQRQRQPPPTSARC
jgi:hypothetical protein